MGLRQFLLSTVFLFRTGELYAPRAGILVPELVLFFIYLVGWLVFSKGDYMLFPT